MADDVELSGHHAASYWLFSHLKGLRQVAIPETALFDSEGVLEAWLFTDASHKNQTECQVARRDFLETNVLRLEAQLQDLAKAKQSEVIAVQVRDAPVYLTETSLDALVRTLCAREIAMNAPVPDLQIPREFPAIDGAGGSFCVQEFVPPSQEKHIVAYFRHASTLSTSLESVAGVSDDDDEEERRAAPYQHNSDLHAGLFSFSNRAWSLNKQHKLTREKTAEENRRRYGTDLDDPVDAKLQTHAQALLRHLITHLHVFFGLQCLELTVDFAHEQTRDRLYLVGAQRIRVQQISFTHVSSPGSSDLNPHSHLKPDRRRTKLCSNMSSDKVVTKKLLVPPELLPTRLYQQPPLPTHANYRICRQCRSNTDVDLAKELMRKQTMLRGVLAKYQAVQEQHISIDSHNEELQKLLERQKQTIIGLQRELDHVRSAAQERDVEALELKLENSSLHTQLTGAVEELQAVTSRVGVAEQRILQAEALLNHRTSVNSDNEASNGTIRQWELQNAHLEQQLGRLQRELEHNQQMLHKLQTKYEKVRANRDELRFQWRFICRKLVDIKEPGVAPPQRIAGGYRSYPTPCDTNVRDVVKWLVDYDAKRVLIDSQKKKSVGKRLRLKLELMRVLGSPKKRKNTTMADSATSLSPSPRRKSRSPSKLSPTTRSKGRGPGFLDELETGAFPSTAGSVPRLCRQLGTTNPKMTLVEEALGRRR